MTKAWADMNVFQKIWKVIVTTKNIIWNVWLFIGILFLDALIFGLIFGWPLIWLLENIPCN
jgi:hypothetical protein